MQLQPYNYQSTFAPADLGVVQHSLESRQQRYDAANTAWAQTKSALYEDPTFDPEVKKKVVEGIENNFENIYKTYNGDLGAATSDLMGMIGASRKNDYFRLNKVALEKQKEYEAMKKAYGAKALEFKPMPKGLVDENGQWRKQEDFAPEVVQDLDREKELARIIDQAKEKYTTQGGRHLTPDGKFYERHTTVQDDVKEKKEQIYKEYLGTAEGQLHLKILRELPGQKVEKPEEALRKYVDDMVDSRSAKPSVTTDDILNPEYTAGLKGNKKDKSTGVTFNSLGQVVVQHPDLNGIKGASDLAAAISANPTSVPLNKLYTKVSTDPAFQEAQKQVNFRARSAWSYAKTKFPKDAKLSDFPELAKIVDNPSAVIDQSALQTDMVRLYNAFQKNDYKEALRMQEAKDRAGKAVYTGLGEYASGNPTMALVKGVFPFLNAKSDQAAVWFDELLGKPVTTGSINPALKAVKDVFAAGREGDNVVNSILQRPENKPGRAVTMHMADELNTAGNKEQNSINKTFNNALPTYLLSAIDRGLLVSNDGSPVDKSDIDKLVGGTLASSNVGLAYDDYGNLHFVVTGHDKKGVVQKVYSFNQQGQNSDVANTMFEQLDDFSGGKITKLRSAVFEPVEGTSYVLDRRGGTKKVELPKGYKIDKEVSADGYRLLKEGKPVTYYDYTAPKSDLDVITVYLVNLGGMDPSQINKYLETLSASDRSRLVTTATLALKNRPVSFETGDDIIDYTSSTK